MSDRGEAVLVLARAPRPGKVKTRLIPALGAQGACNVHTALLKHTLEICLASDRPVFCFTDEELCIADLDPQARITWRRQHTGHLGWRMQAALASVFPLARRLVLVGSDCAVLTRDYLDAAFAALDDHDFVLGPAEDGGYVLIGSRLPSVWQGSDRLAGARFGGQHARLDTEAALRPHGSLARLPMLWDIDTWEDLRRARRSAILGPLLETGENQ